MVNKKGRVNSNSTDEDPSLRIESSAIINLRGVPTKLNKYNFILSLSYHGRDASNNEIPHLLQMWHVINKLD